MVLVGKPEDNRPAGRYRRRWENNIKMYLKEMGSQVVKWIRLAQSTDKCERGNQPSGSIKCGEFPDWRRQSARRTLPFEAKSLTECNCGTIQKLHIWS